MARPASRSTPSADARRRRSRGRACRNAALTSGGWTPASRVTSGGSTSTDCSSTRSSGTDGGRSGGRPEPPVLLVHGLGGSTTNWLSVGPELADAARDPGHRGRPRGIRTDPTRRPVRVARHERTAARGLRPRPRSVRGDGQLDGRGARSRARGPAPRAGRRARVGEPGGPPAPPEPPQRRAGRPFRGDGRAPARAARSWKVGPARSARRGSSTRRCGS